LKMMEEKVPEKRSMSMVEPKQSFSTEKEETCLIERFGGAVRNFILRSACKVDCFFTIKEEVPETQEKLKQRNERKIFNLEEDNKELFKEYTEKHFVALPSIIFAKSRNPRHKLHLTCHVSPPLEPEEIEDFKFNENVLRCIAK